MPKISAASASLLSAFLAVASCGYAQTCSNNDFKGTFSGVVTGSFISPPPGIPPGPTARVGLVSPDGKGNTSIIATLSLDGLIFPESYGGTYTINPDCSAVVLLNVAFPGTTATVPFTFNGMLANEGQNMDLVLVNPAGTDLRIGLHKQRKAACTAGDLNGEYSLNMAGTVLNWLMTPSGPFARVGKVVFDGVSTLTATVHTSYAGLIEAETITGTYTMGANCIFNATLDASNDKSWFGVMADTANGASIMSSAPGGVITGTLTTVY
jgi:hypothetical protein